MRTVSGVVLVPACNPLSCCTCLLLVRILALVSGVCHAPVVTVIPVCSPSPAVFFLFILTFGTYGCVCLGVTWRCQVSLISGGVGDLKCQLIPIGGEVRSPRLSPLCSGRDTLLCLSLWDLSPLAPEAEHLCCIVAWYVVPRIPTWLVCFNMNTFSLRKGPLPIQKMPGYPYAKEN